jgi:molybdopterin/thiamine biosynthesis adenylyltransferase
MSRGDEIFSRVHGWEAGRLGQAHILVVGAGALGNEVLKNLALLGIGRISILDFDQVEPHNLSRSVLYRAEDARLGRAKAQAAAQAILALHPEVQVQIFCGDVGSDLGLGLLRQVDVVIGCVDNRLARLYLNRLCWRAGVPWVDGGILQLSGQATAYVPGHSCYECQLSTAEWTDIRARMGCADMAERYAQAGMQVTTPLAAALIGAIQVQMALQLIFTEPSARKGGEMFSYEGGPMRAEWYTRRPLQDECLAHAQWPAPVTSLALTQDMQVADVLARLKETFGFRRPVLVLPHDVALELAGMRSQRRTAVVVPRPKLSAALAAAFGGEDGEVVGIPKGQLIDRVGEDFVYPATPLWQLGIPFGDVLQVRDGSTRQYVVLAGDLATVSFQAGVFEVPMPWHKALATHCLPREKK